MSETIIDLETETRNGKIPSARVKHGAFQIYTGEGRARALRLWD